MPKKQYVPAAPGWSLIECHGGRPEDRYLVEIPIVAWEIVSAKGECLPSALPVTMDPEQHGGNLDVRVFVSDPSGQTYTLDGYGGLYTADQLRAKFGKDSPL